MRSSPDALALIKRFEGFSAVPYYCPAGYLTVGYGHVLSTYQPMKLTEAEAEALLMKDMRVAEAAVERLIHVPLAPCQFGALVSFTYNLGAGALQRSTLRRKVNRQEHADAVLEFGKWVFASGKRLSGLIARRRAEAALYRQFQSLM